jgi:hypothetical protein
MKLPTAAEINIHDSLDERSACEHFLGKSVAEAETLFRDNALYYQEDLMFMGPIAFRYYVPAFINYIRGEGSSRGDSDAINCFHGLVKFWIDQYPGEVVPIANEVASACLYILSNYQKFDVSPHYGDLRSAFNDLVSELRRPNAG